jgi:ribosomal protein S18 acetylase RimI-like enzyme
VSGDTIAVVPIAAAHVEGFRACLDGVARERRWLAMTAAPSLERMTSFVRDNLANDVSQFVALDGTRVVGFADVLPGWAQAITHVGTFGMGVDAAYRRRGIGRRLIEAAIAKARARGITRIQLEVRADNAAAIALYRSTGFEVEAVKPRAMRFDGMYHDALQMRLLVDPPASRAA